MNNKGNEENQHNHNKHKEHDHHNHNQHEEQKHHSHQHHNHEHEDMHGHHKHGHEEHKNHDHSHGHSGHHGGHGGHHEHMVEDFKKRFWISLVLSIPILYLSPMIQMLIGYEVNFTGNTFLLFLLSTIVFFLWWETIFTWCLG